MDKRSDLSQQVFADTKIQISGFYYDKTLRSNVQFKFIDSFIDSNISEIDVNMEDEEGDGYQEILSRNINWVNTVTINLMKGNISPDNLMDIMLVKASQTNLYLFASKIQRQCKILDPKGEIVQMKLQYLKTDQDSSQGIPFKVRARLMLYGTLFVEFDCSEISGRFHISNSNFLQQTHLEILNKIIYLSEFKYVEIKSLVQILLTEHF